MNPAHDEISEIFQIIFDRDIENSDSELYLRDLQDLAVNSSAREHIKALSPLAISELLKKLSNKPLDRIFRILSNEKLLAAIPLLSLNESAILRDKLIKKDTQYRYTKLLANINLKPNLFEVPAFLRKINQKEDKVFNNEKEKHHKSNYEKLFSIEEILKGLIVKPEDSSANNSTDKNDAANKKIEDLQKQLEQLKNKNLQLQNQIISEELKSKENLENLNRQFGKSADKLEANYKSKIKDLEQQYSEAIQKRIDENLTAYVNSAVKTLDNIEIKLKFSAGLWSFIASVTAIVTLIVGIGLSLFGYYYGPPIHTFQWPELLIISIKGIFIISALAGAATFAFAKSNAFTHEALIVSNRAHAIKFGKLYLEIYGNTVERSEMVKIFENWNISPATAFSKNMESKSLDVEKVFDILNKAKEIAQPSLKN